MTWKDDSHIVYRSRWTEWDDFKGSSTPSRPAAGRPNRSRSPAAAGAPSPRTGRRWRTTGSSANSAPGNGTVAARRTTSGFMISPQRRRPTSRTTPRRTSTRCGSAAGSTFVSDRDENKRFNLYVYDTGTGKTEKLTSFADYDIKFPSLGDSAIVFENGGWIYRFDLATGATQKVSITIAEDFVSGRGGLHDVGKEVTNFEISPDGSRALFGARGDVFTVPAKYGNTRNLTQTPGVHERNSKWSPDGKSILYVSDATGEDEIWVAPQDGLSPARQITTGLTRTNISRTGRPTAKRSCGPTRNCASSTSTSRPGPSRRSPSRRHGNSASTPGPPTASGSRTRSPKKRRCRRYSSTRWRAPGRSPSRTGGTNPAARRSARTGNISFSSPREISTRCSASWSSTTFITTCPGSISSRSRRRQNPRLSRRATR